METFAQKEEIIPFSLAEIVQLPQEISIKTIGDVEPESVNTEFIYPALYAAENMSFYVTSL